MLLSVEEAAKFLGVSKSTMRRWEAEGRLNPDRTPGGHRRYRSEALAQMTVHPLPHTERVTIAYARVSSQDQKADLERQALLLSEFCTKNGWTHEVIRDVGSGMNYHKKGLRELLQRIMRHDVECLRQTKRCVLGGTGQNKELDCMASATHGQTGVCSEIQSSHSPGASRGSVCL
jgi:excisionase family DNA binding protein